MPTGPAAARALVLAALAAAGTAHAEWEWGASVGALYGDNLTRAQNAADKRAAGAVTANASAADFIPIDGEDSVTISGEVRGELYNRYHGLTNATAAVTASYRHKFGVGAQAPWASLAVTTSYDGYRDDLRTSTFLDVRAQAGLRFDERFDASLALYYERRYDDHGESIVPGISGKVFELAGQGAEVRAGYVVSDTLYVDAKAGVRRGDVESTSQRSLQIFLASSAITNDPVWGDPNLYAYRLRGTTYTGALTASYAVSNASSLDFAYEYTFTRAAQGLEYTTGTVSLTFVYRY